MANASKTTLSLVIAVAVLATIAACAAPDLAEYSDVRARLDPETHTIVTPLDAYVVEGRDVFLVDHANDLLISDCMAQSGLDYPRITSDWQTRPVMPDRTYGVWDLAWAEEYGYDIPSDEQSQTVSELEADQPESWWQAARTCLASVDLLPVYGLFFDNESTPADRGVVEAAGYAAATPEWKAARAIWVDCLSEHGLRPSDDKSFAPEIPASLDAQIEVAVQDVKCKDENGLVQQLADIEAKYEAAYIDSHESELTAFGQKVDDSLAQAREIIATHGG